MSSVVRVGHLSSMSNPRAIVVATFLVLSNSILSFRVFLVLFVLDLHVRV